MQSDSLYPVDNICSYSGLAPNRHLAIIWTSQNTINWHMISIINKDFTHRFPIPHPLLYFLNLVEQLNRYITFGSPDIRRSGYVITIVEAVRPSISNHQADSTITTVSWNTLGDTTVMLQPLNKRLYTENRQFLDSVVIGGLALLQRWCAMLIDRMTHVCVNKPGHIASGNGPLTRYVKLRVAHAPEMLATFFPPPTSKETDS